MNFLLPLLICVISSIALPSFAQVDSTVMDSVALPPLTIKQSTHYSYRYLKGVRKTNYIQVSQRDTSGIVVRQERDYYISVDTGEAINRHYLLEYNPNTLQGFYQTEQLAIKDKPYSIKKTTFKNYDRRSNKRYWVKTQQPNSQQLFHQVRYEYDNNGYLIGKETTRYGTTPTSTSTEKVTRNAAGNMLTWVSFDDDGDTKTQARSFKASYLHDTLLLRSDDQLYYNHSTVINQYDKNGQLKKTEKKVGNASTNGTVKYNNETLLLYKEGRPYKLTEKNFKKKVKTITYEYDGATEIQQVVTPDKSYTDRIIVTYHEQFPELITKRTETKEGEAFLTEEWRYEDSTQQLLQHTITELRDNGKHWRTEEQYNEQGDVLVKRFFVGGVLTTEDRYTYIYQ